MLPFHTQTKKTLGTRLVHACCVKLRYGCCVCIYAGSRFHPENRDPRGSWDIFNAVFLSICRFSVFCTSFHEKSEEQEDSSTEFLKKLFFLSSFCRSKDVFAQSWRYPLYML